MFFHVSSETRGEVRKVLTAAGLPSAEVVRMRNGQLGKALYDAVKANKLSLDTANAVCGGTAQVRDDAIVEAEVVEIPAEVEQAQQPKTNGHTNGSSNDAQQQALSALLQLLGSQKIDEKAVRSIVDDQLKQRQQRPHVIEIRSEQQTVTLKEQTHAQFETVLRVINTRVQGRRLHVWLVGPSGSGKSFLASQCAKAAGLDYYSTSAIQSKYDLIGFTSPTGNPETLRTPFRNAFENGGVFAWDDIDASDPRAFVAFSEALANGRFAFPDKMVEQHADFVCVASANTWGTGATADYVGRNKIDGATLTRFVRLVVDYDETLERDMVGDAHATWAGFVQAIRAAVRKEGIKVLITPRHTLQGAALLSAGLKRTDVEQMTVFAGLDADTVNRLRRAA